MQKQFSKPWIYMEIGGILLAFLSLYGSLMLIGQIDYILGKGTQSVALRLLAMSKVIIPLLPITIIYAVRLFVSRRYPQLAHWNYASSFLVYFVILAISILAVFRFPYAGPNMFFKGFHDNAKNKINPTEFYKWATEVRKKFSKQNEPVPLPRQDMPDFLQAFWSSRTPNVLISPLYDTNVIVDIYYGGGFGHWGVKVGTIDMKLNSDARFRCAQIAPGIYTYYGP